MTINKNANLGSSFGSTSTGRALSSSLTIVHPYGYCLLPISAARPAINLIFIAT